MPEVAAENTSVEDTEKSEQEEFNDTLDDATILHIIEGWEQESQEFYGNLERIWEENLLYYKGIQTDVQKIRGKHSKSVENRIFMAVETEIPLVTGRLPDAVVKPVK